MRGFQVRPGGLVVVAVEVEPRDRAEPGGAVRRDRLGGAAECAPAAERCGMIAAQADTGPALTGPRKFPFLRGRFTHPSVITAKEFGRCRFLKVSGELVHRSFKPNPSDDPPSAGRQECRDRP